MEHQGRYRDEIDLVQMVKVLIKRKWIIIGGTLIIALLAVILSLVLPRVYKSEGFFQLGRGIDVDLDELKDIQEKIRKDFQDNMLDNQTLQNSMLLNETLQNIELTMMNVSIPDYKKYASRFTNPQKFVQFLNNKVKNKEIAAGLSQSLRAAEDIEQWIEPVYAYSKKDLKELAQNTRDISNFVLGVQLLCEQESPEKARTAVEVIGEFIKNSVLYGKLKDYIDTQLNKCKTESKKYDNIIINDEFKLGQLKVKLDSIHQLMKKYPEAKDMVGRELFAIQHSGQRYLSPVAQVVGIESHIVDVKENLAQTQRKKQLADLKLLFLLELKQQLPGEMIGENLLNQCIKLTDLFFNKEDFPGDVIREVRNDLAVDFDNFSGFKEGMQFISGPTMSKKAVSPKKVLIIAIGIVMGFFLSIFLAFFFDWWVINRKKIINGNEDNL